MKTPVQQERRQGEPVMPQEPASGKVLPTLELLSNRGMMDEDPEVFFELCNEWEA